MRPLIPSLLLSLLVSGTALADATAEIKAGTSIENRELKGEAASFKKGDTVYVWSSVSGADGTTVQHLWKRDGKEVRKASFAAKSARWRVNSKFTSASPGDYVVEVWVADKKIGEVKFKVE
jgi:hypothetical protein